MPPTAVITPSAISKETARVQTPEVPYDWARQARNNGVELKVLAVKDVRPEISSRKATSKKAPQKKRKR